MRCPLLNKDCIGAKCAWWMKFTSRKAVTLELVAEESCVVPRLPQMLIEIIHNTGGVQTVNEEIRNRMEHVVHNTRKQNDIFTDLIEASRRKALPTGD